MAIGVCILDRENGNVLFKKAYYLGLEPNTQHDPTTWSEFWSKNIPVLNEIMDRARNTTPGTAMRELIHDIDEYGTNENLIMVSDNPAYDLPWILDRIQGYLGGQSDRTRSILQQKTYSMPVSTECYARGVMKGTGDKTRDEDMLKYLGLEKLPDGIVHDHRPENDAHKIAWMHWMFEQKVKN
jgi:hypothetical protein